MTNADKIRAMTDEELAPIIMCPNGADGITCIDNVRGLSCNECSLDWLRAGSEENHG